jgi:hypothetical protein
VKTVVLMTYIKVTSLIVLRVLKISSDKLVIMKNLLFLLFSLVSISTFAQHRNCGTIQDAASYELLQQRAWEVSQLVHNAPEQAELRDDEITWLPVKYHLISRTNQVTYARVNDILGLHCRLNEEYADQEIQFYINDGFNYFQSDAAYDNPGANSAALSFQRDNVSINVFVANNATTGGDQIPGSVTLGYYSPGQDWIVLRKDQSNYSANTFVHEMGHFLSLPHTHNGWDATTWGIWSEEFPNQCAPMFAPSDGTLVEFQDGTNCQTAGDFICDTPPDYAFGLSAGGCSWTEEVCDPNGDIVDPMEINYMSYFDCSNQIFTEGQRAQMIMDLSTPARSYLTFDSGPDRTTAITEVAQLTSPDAGATTDFYNGVNLTWSDVPHTTTYFLQIAQNSAFTLLVREYFDWQPGAYISDLEAGTNYYWRVRAYNEYSTCTEWSQSRQFSTGAETTAITEISEVEAMTVSPNPVSAGANLTINIQSSSIFKANIELVNLSGQVLNTLENQNFSQGSNTINIAMDNIATGLYFVRVSTDKGVMNRRVIVAE